MYIVTYTIISHTLSGVKEHRKLKPDFILSVVQHFVKVNFKQFCWCCNEVLTSWTLVPKYSPKLEFRLIKLDELTVMFAWEYFWEVENVDFMSWVGNMQRFGAVLCVILIKRRSWWQNMHIKICWKKFISIRYFTSWFNKRISNYLFKFWRESWVINVFLWYKVRVNFKQLQRSKQYYSLHVCSRFLDTIRNF